MPPKGLALLAMIPVSSPTSYKTNKALWNWWWLHHFYQSSALLEHWCFASGSFLLFCGLIQLFVWGRWIHLFLTLLQFIRKSSHAKLLRKALFNAVLQKSFGSYFYTSINLIFFHWQWLLGAFSKAATEVLKNDEALKTVLWITCFLALFFICTENTQKNQLTFGIHFLICRNSCILPLDQSCHFFHPIGSRIKI